MTEPEPKLTALRVARVCQGGGGALMMVLGAMHAAPFASFVGAAHVALVIWRWR